MSRAAVDTQPRNIPGPYLTVREAETWDGYKIDIVESRDGLSVKYSRGRADLRDARRIIRSMRWQAWYAGPCQVADRWQRINLSGRVMSLYDLFLLRESIMQRIAERYPKVDSWQSMRKFREQFYFTYNDKDALDWDPIDRLDPKYFCVIVIRTDDGIRLERRSLKVLRLARKAQKIICQMEAMT